MAVAQARYRLVRAPALVPCLLATAVLVALGASEAGFNPTAWYPATLFVLGLLGVTLVALGPPRSLPRPLVVALMLFAAYMLWTYLSIAWAEQQGAAVEGANRTALYLCVFALYCLWPLDSVGGRIVLGTLGLGIVGVGAVELIRIDGAADPAGYIVEGRIVEPAGYVNANAALWTVGLLACLPIAAGRDVPAVLRGLALGGAGLLGALALLAQSRGWLLALPLGVLAFLLISPGRVRALLVVLAIGAGMAAVIDPVLAVHDDFSRAGLDALLADAAHASWVMAGALTLLGVGAALLDRRAEPRPRIRSRRRLSQPVLLGIAVAAVGLGAAALVAADVPSRASDAWDDFKKGGQPEAGGSRFSSVGTYRYDFWRVAWDEFADNPVVGIGVENFQASYLRRGDSFEKPRYAHSLELGVLSQTGLVGGILLFGALGATLVAAARRLSRDGPLRWVSAGGLAVFAYWVGHASVDWLWEFPALGGAAFMALGLAAAPVAAPEAQSEARRPLGPAAALGVFACCLPLAVAVGAPWLSERQVQRALDEWRSSPGTALDRLDRAAGLNPLSPRPQLTAGTIAVNVGALDVAVDRFRAALRREPENSYALLELGVIASEQGRSAVAETYLERALELAPRDEIIEGALEEVQAGRQIRLADVNAGILGRANARRQPAP
jgi:O-antigen ligase